VWSGDRLQPQSLHVYVYVQNGPVNYIDPAGLYQFFTDGQVTGIEEILWSPLMESAWRHNVSGSNMGPGAFAALMLTLMWGERGSCIFSEPLTGCDLPLASTWSQDLIGFMLPDTEWMRELAGPRAGGLNKAIGPGNVEESTIDSITRGYVRSGNLAADEPNVLMTGVDYDLVFPFCAPECELAVALTGGSYNCSAITYGDRMLKWDWLYVFDMMGATIQEGIYNMQFHGEDPAVFNLIIWYIGGSATDLEINDIGHKSRPRAEWLLDNMFPEALAIVRRKMAKDDVPYHYTIFDYQKGASYYRWLKEFKSGSP
jgi:hypothetical protein